MIVVLFNFCALNRTCIQARKSKSKVDMSHKPLDVNKLFAAIYRDDAAAVSSTDAPMDSPTYPGSLLFHALLFRAYNVAEYLLTKGATLRQDEYFMFSPKDRKEFRAHLTEKDISSTVKELLKEVIMSPLHKAAVHRRIPLLAAYSRAEEGKTRRARRMRRARRTYKSRRVNRK